MTDDEIAYYRRRAVQELAAAENAHHSAAAMVHFTLAQMYSDAVVSADASSLHLERALSSNESVQAGP